jgi:metal-dependent amidase/aminoacylase/carboxypeptidase family protein
MRSCSLTSTCRRSGNRYSPEIGSIAKYTKSTWGIRSEDNERLAELIPKVHACFEAAAAATGCRLEINPVDHPYDNMRNNSLMTALFAANSVALGRPMPTEVEVGRSGGSSDMGNVSQVVPSIHPMIGLDSGGAVNHQADFAACTITPTGEKGLRDGALAMAHTIIDMAEQDVWERL